MVRVRFVTVLLGLGLGNIVQPFFLGHNILHIVWIPKRTNTTPMQWEIKCCVWDCESFQPLVYDRRLERSPSGTLQEL